MAASASSSMIRMSHELTYKRSQRKRQAGSRACRLPHRGIRGRGADRADPVQAPMRREHHEAAVASATKCVLSPVFTRNSTALRPSFLASLKASTTSRRLRDRLVRRLRGSRRPDAGPFCGRDAVRIDVGDHDAVGGRRPERTQRARASARRPTAQFGYRRRATAVLRHSPACSSAGNVPSLTEAVFSVPFVDSS